jgi:hypothetical protein
VNVRRDSFHIAGWKRAHQLRGCECSPEMIAASQLPRFERSEGTVSHIAHDPEYFDIPAAQEGDVWRLTSAAGNLRGYALACPEQSCELGAHGWDHARDCADRGNAEAPSCWNWTGTPEDGTLTASPSLHCVKEWGGCGWHGWLQNGVMHL